MFEGIVGSGYHGDIAIDDIYMSATSCLGLAGCDFEDGSTCSWTQSKSDDFDWLVNSGTTGSMHTGPSADHTLRTPAGQFLLFSLSCPSQLFSVSYLSLFFCTSFSFSVLSLLSVSFFLCLTFLSSSLSLFLSLSYLFLFSLSLSLSLVIGDHIQKYTNDPHQHLHLYMYE